MGDFRNDKQMTLVQMCVRAYIIRACVRVSFVGECGNEKELLTEQKKIALLLTAAPPKSRRDDETTGRRWSERSERNPC